MARTSLHGNSKFNLAQWDRLLSALNPSSPYRKRLSRCGTLRYVTHGDIFRCKLPPCPSCRSMYATRQRKALRRMFTDATNNDGATITIVVDLAFAPHEIEAQVAKVRKDLRNLVDAQRRKNSRWQSFRCIGWLETDALDPADLPLLGSERADLLTALGAGAGLTKAPLWIPTVNLIARFDDLDWQEVQRAFSGQWRHERQALVTPFYAHLTVEENCNNTTNYALKHRCTINIQGSEQDWHPRWMAEYYLWLSSWSASFKRTRFFVGPKRSRKTPPSILPSPSVDDDDDYGSPVVMVASSVLPTLYNW